MQIARGNVGLELRDALLALVVKDCATDTWFSDSCACAAKHAACRTGNDALILNSPCGLPAALLALAKRTPLEHVRRVLAGQGVHAPVHVQASLHARA